METIKKYSILLLFLLTISISYAAIDFTPLGSGTSPAITPSLQEVTDRGAVTDNEITVNNNLLVDGNIGIGTTNPAKPLHVVMNEGSLPSLGSQVGLFQNNLLTTSNTIFALISGHTGTRVQSIAGFQFGDKDAVNSGYVYYYNYANALTLGTNKQERMRISSNGNVGIGTSAPNQKLEVVGNINASGTVYASAFESHSPIALGIDSDVGYTRLCYQATNGDVVLQSIQLVNGNYQPVYNIDTQGICDKNIIKESYSVTEFSEVNGEIKEIEIKYNTYEKLYSKQQSEKIIKEIRDALQVWQSNMTYYEGDIFQYNNKGYEVIQEHTSQDDWLPDQVSSLYKTLVLHQYNEVTAWVQPQGSHDCYPIDAQVTFNGKTYQSTHSCNVWSPSTYPAGWKEI